MQFARGVRPQGFDNILQGIWRMRIVNIYGSAVWHGSDQFKTAFGASDFCDVFNDFVLVAGYFGSHSQSA